MAGSYPKNKRFRRSAPRRAEAQDGPLRLYGLHTIAAALANPQRQIGQIWLTENAQRRLTDMGAIISPAPEIVTTKDIGRLVAGDAVHQGAVIEATPLAQVNRLDLQDMRLVMVLDRITDPHNVGAIMRSAVAFGVDALITTRRHSAVETAVLAKSASGALDMIRHLTVANLPRQLRELSELGFNCLGLDSAGEVDLPTAPITGKIALVLGAEGSGLRQGTREACDTVARLDMPGAIKSLNVSNAAALSLYVVTSALNDPAQ